MKNKSIITIICISVMITLAPLVFGEESEINIGIQRNLLQDENGEWTLYDKRHGYSIILPSDWKYNVETDFRTGDLVMINSNTTSAERFSPYIYIQTISDDKHSFGNITKNLDLSDAKILDEFIINKNSSSVSEINIISFERRDLPEMYVFDISSEQFFINLTPSKLEASKFYVNDGRIFELGMYSGESDFENFLTGFRNSVASFEPSYAYFENLSPRQQTANGLPSKAVICKDNFVLVLKLTDGKPACLRSESYQKIIERGWSSWDLIVD